MAQITSHRRNLAAFLNPSLSMHQPKSSSATAAAAIRRRAAPPNPTIPTIIRTVSDHNVDPKKEQSSDEIKKTSQKKEPSNFQKQLKTDFLICRSEIELGDLLCHNNVKVVSADMPPFMQIHAVNFARKAYDSLENFTPKTLALTLKKEFDGVYGAAWHCIVGSSFGSFVTHSVGGFIYFSMDHKLHVLLFKTSIKRAT